MKLTKSIEKIMSRKTRVYIFPTKMGGYLNGLIFLMFLLSIGYSNNLLLIFTLFLFGLNLIWLVQTHFYMNAFKLDSIQILPGHAEEYLMLTLRWQNSPEQFQPLDLTLLGDKDQCIFQDRIKISQRGLYHWSKLKLSSGRPFGLYTAWKYIPIDTNVIVYPKKARSFPAIKTHIVNLSGNDMTPRRGPHDVENLGPYQGEEYRRISWKHYARSGELVVKEGQEEARSEVRFMLNSNQTTDEEILAVITSQILYCHQNGVPFSLELPTRLLKTSLGATHLKQCLEVLALC